MIFVSTMFSVFSNFISSIYLAICIGTHKQPLNKEKVNLRNACHLWKVSFCPWILQSLKHKWLTNWMQNYLTIIHLTFPYFLFLFVLMFCSWIKSWLVLFCFPSASALIHKRDLFESSLVFGAIFLNFAHFEGYIFELLPNYSDFYWIQYFFH